jgi:hypothetical protein
MLFFFDFDRDECISTGTDLLTVAVSELTRSHRIGYHLVVMPRSTAVWLADNLPVSELDRATLRRLAKEYTQSGGLPEIATVFARVTYDHVGPPVPMGNEVRLGLEVVASLGITQKPVLVVEDLKRDGLLYRKIFEGHSGKFPGGISNFELAHGGGDSIVDILEDKIEQQRIVLTIVDSDKLAPNQPESTKVRRLNQLVGRRNWMLAGVIVLPCHEIENLVDKSIFRALPCISERESEYGALLLLDDAEEREGIDEAERFWLFFDLKNGMRLADVAKIENSEVRDWILRRLSLIGSPPEIRGFGTNVLSSLLANGSALGLFRDYIRSKRFKLVFGPAFERAMWIGVSARRQFS